MRTGAEPLCTAGRALLDRRQFHSHSATMNMAGTAIAALALFYLPDGSRGDVAFFHPAVALSGVGIMCWLAADSSRKMEAQS